MARPSLTSRWACVQISKPSDIDNDSSSKNIPRDTGSGHRDQAPGVELPRFRGQLSTRQRTFQRATSFRTPLD